MKKIACLFVATFLSVSAIAQTVQGSTIIKGTLAVTSAKSTSGYWCLQIDSSGNITNTGAICGSGGMVYPASGVAVSTGSAWRSPLYTDITALWASGTCSGALYSDSSCSASMTGQFTVSTSYNVGGSSGIILDESGAGNISVITNTGTINLTSYGNIGIFDNLNNIAINESAAGGSLRFTANGDSTSYIALTSPSINMAGNFKNTKHNAFGAQSSIDYTYPLILLNGPASTLGPSVLGIYENSTTAVGVNGAVIQTGWTPVSSPSGYPNATLIVDQEANADSTSAGTATPFGAFIQVNNNGNTVSDQMIGLTVETNNAGNAPQFENDSLLLQPENYGTGTITAANGAQSTCYNYSTGTITSCRSYSAYPPTNTGGGVITGWNAFYISGWSAGYGTLPVSVNGFDMQSLQGSSTANGIYLGQVTAPTPFQINSVGTAPSYFAGSMNVVGAFTLGTQNTTAGGLTVRGSNAAGGSITINGDGGSPGSSVINVNTAGTTLNLGSTNAYVTTAGALTVASCTGCGGGGGLSGMTQYGLGVAATASTMTSSVQPVSWTTGHTFVPVWQPSGSALAPTAVDANTLSVSYASTAGGAPPTGSCSGDLSGTEPACTVAKVNGVSFSASPSAGQVPNTTSGSASSWTATPTLGAAGTLGSLTFGNATSGLLTLETAAGAITSYTLQLPVAQPTAGNTYLSCTAASPAVCTWVAGGSMTWPTGAGYALYSGSSSWSTSHITDSGSLITYTEASTMTQTGNTVPLTIYANSTSADMLDVYAGTSGTPGAKYVWIDSGGNLHQYGQVNASYLDASNWIYATNGFSTDSFYQAVTLAGGNAGTVNSTIGISLLNYMKNGASSATQVQMPGYLCANTGACATGGTVTGAWTGLSLTTQFGQSTNDVYNGSAPMEALSITPTVDVATTSTGAWDMLYINPTITSQGAGLSNYLIWSGVGGVAKFTVSDSGAVNVASARKSTFTCTSGGTITISNTNELAISSVIISMNTAGGTITTPPAMKTTTAGTGFSVLCGATDTSTYDYEIVN